MRLVPVLCVAVLLVSAAGGPVAATQQEETVTLTVTVVDAEGQNPGGVTLNATWDGGSSTAQTASNGKAFLDVEQGADVEIHVEDDTYVRNFPKTVEDAEAGDVTVEVARKGSVRVRVTDSDGDLGNVSVFLARDDRLVVEGDTGADGVFNTGTVERGQYTVTLFKTGYFQNETQVSVTGDVFRTFTLERGTTNIEIQVEDDHFSPPESVSDAQVTVENIGTQRTTSGTVTFTVPVNSDYRVSATKDGYRNASRIVNVRERPVDLTMSIQRERALVVQPVNTQVVVGQSVLVEVVNAYGEPVSGAQVRLDGETVGETDDAGEIRVGIDTAGEHTIRARSGSVQSSAVVVTGVEAGDDETPTASPSPSPSPTPTEAETPAPTDSPTPATQTPLPGFGPAAALAALALAGIALLVRRR